MAEKIELTDADKKARPALARALWSAEQGDKKFDDQTAKQEAYQAEKAPFVQKANKVLRQLKSRGVSLVQEES
ncbi:hypothetical protein [Parasphingopyxis sp.]|uniref:hypothetical protein n=1 Tax=Parasphingopyxis sp. TaxID=1920299 RepID=UPI00260C2FE6|nr:hypothetical protein [Parasphingopyxis sp.]